MSSARSDRARRALASLPHVPLNPGPTPLDDMLRLARVLGVPTGTRLLVKRDDAMPFGGGGNKVRKLEVLAAEMARDGVDTIITTGGVQSNHARATAALAARTGRRCLVVANGTPPARLTGNALLVSLLGAEVRYVATREERAPAMEALAAEVRARGGRPRVVPLGASEPLGALGYVRAVAELIAQGPPPDVIFHASSSGGTQAGIVAGCALHGLHTGVVGISADEPRARLEATIAALLDGMAGLLDVEADALRLDIEVDDGFVGEGYGIPTAASVEAASLVARHEALFVEHTYTAKALAGMLAYLRDGRIRDARSVLFWHTGGFPGLFA